MTEEYLAFVLSKECRASLLSLFKPKFLDVRCHHVTLLRPGNPFLDSGRTIVSEMVSGRFGTVSLFATGYVGDDATDAVTIRLSAPQTLMFMVKRGFLHVTMSVAAGHTAAEANNLVQAKLPATIEPLRLEGELQILTRNKDY